MPPSSHALFANDTIIFTNVGRLSLINLGKLLGEYQNSYGQKINRMKSSFYLSTKFDGRKSTKIELIT